MRDTASLNKFIDLIDKDPNLGKMAESKISKTRKHRLILFGIPDDISENRFKSEILALEESMGKPIEIIKVFKNEKRPTNLNNYIIDVEAKVAERLVDLGKFVINLNRIRIHKYIVHHS
ncbi:hypothetical protein JTE90_012414 [Oedothorax gibbosus]|uniref:Pre-C2HC domain-containing protein n=1 Tax=Oedothorax gibbosus TaxID=931172 RepID=A0AAV6TXU0_9ARAC|nr:hypothetical protein JTE90_012414 [Oedothorax gibbosus]